MSACEHSPGLSCGPSCRKEDILTSKSGPDLSSLLYRGEVVLSGISGRLPESDNMAEFYEHLTNKMDMTTTDNRRWEQGAFGSPERSGKIKHPFRFDFEFFAINRKQATIMDPQLWMLLEVSYEAIIDAGLSLQSIKGSRTGVYMGVCSDDASFKYLVDPPGDHPHFLIGFNRSILANRISYFFDLKGPSITIDSACSSSAMCLDYALQDIRNGVADAALVGGANLCLSPQRASKFATKGFTSPKGQSKVFDVEADGYCRSDGVVVVFLQKSENCKRIYMTVVHAKCNTDGYKEQGISYPSWEMQSQLIKEVYNEAEVNIHDVDYVEAHGTGTQAGDMNETLALSTVFLKSRSKPLWIGSIKSNMGHAEGAAGVASIAKIVKIMRDRVIPPNLHYKTPNPGIPALLDGSFRVVTDNTPWKGKYIGMNSFGFGGTNCHIIFRSHEQEVSEPHVASNKPRLFVCNSRTEEGLQAVLAEAKKNCTSVEFQALIQDSANTGPLKLPYRGYTILNASQDIQEIQKCPTDPRPVWLVFTGVGSQWHGMARHMMQLDTFRKSIMKSSEALKPFGIDLYDLLMNGDEAASREITNVMVSITSLQVALFDLLTSMDIKADGILGHSIGEVACGYADGCLTNEETILASYWRGRCVCEGNLPAGKMAAVGLSWEECKRRCPPGVEAACHNNLETVTISGLAEPTAKFIQELAAENVFVREVQSSDMAYHSRLMKKIAPQLKANIEKFIKPRKRSAKWICTSIPESEWNLSLAQYSSPDYYVNNLISPVLFQEGLQKIPDKAIVLEIGPHGLLQSVLKQSLSREATIVGTMKRFYENNIEYLFSALGKCYMTGMSLSPLKAYPPVQFPVASQTPLLSPCISKTWNYSQEMDPITAQDVEFAQNKAGASSDELYKIDISEASPDSYLMDHTIDGRVLFPATGYLVLVWQTLAKLKNLPYEMLPVMFQNVTFHHAVVLSPTGPVTLSVNLVPATGEFRLCEGDTLLASGTITSPDEPMLDKDQYTAVQNILNKDVSMEFALNKEELYKEYRLGGYEYGPSFQGIVRVSQSGERGDILWNGCWISFLDTVLQITLLPMHNMHHQFLPTRFRSVKVDPRAHPKPAEEYQEPTLIPVYYDSTLSIIICGGVEIQGLQSSITSKRGQVIQPTIMQHCFVPYSADSDSSKSLEQYASDCLSLASANLKRLIQESKGSSLPHKSFIQTAITNLETPSQFTLQSYSSTSNTCLFNVLAKVFNLPQGAMFPQEAQQILQSAQVELGSDVLLSCLENSDILKLCLDIIFDNDMTKKVTIFEAGATNSALYRKVLPILKSRTMLAINYIAADNVPLPKDLSTFGVKGLQWSPATSASAPAVKANLIILKHVLHHQKDIEATLHILSDILLPGGFLLVEEITNNFLIHLTLDVCSQGSCQEVNPHGVYGRYLTENSWLQLFTSQNYEVVFRRSDNLLSTLFLLRKKECFITAPVVIAVDDLSCSWLDDLKSKLEEISNGPEDGRLWLISKQNLSGLIGLTSCLRLENGGNKVRSIFISNLKSSSKTPDISVASEDFQKLVSKDLVFNVFRDGEWGSFKHLLLSSDELSKEKPCEFAYVNTLTRGDLSSLKWIQSHLNYFQTNGKNIELCSIYYSALNFRDIMLASGRLPADAIPLSLAIQDSILGYEFSGRDSRGRRVMGVSSAMGLATAVDVPGYFLWEIPDDWSMEDGASVPLVYSTVYYALLIRGQLRKGDKILIHSGSGGIGQAAIRVALSLGCEVFTTVGSNEKKLYLQQMFPQLNDRHFSNSRNLSFVYDILRETNGKGVKAVLNSLAEDRLLASIRLLDRYGRFLEIGKYDISQDNPLGMALFAKNITFHGIFLDDIFDDSDKTVWNEIHGLVQEGIERGVVQPLNSTVFDKDQLEDAFRFMAQSKHIGKVLVKVRNEEAAKVIKPSTIKVAAVPKSYCDPDKTYIIIGGLGGFGLQLAQWLVSRGAKKLVLSSRSGIKSSYQYRKVSMWRKENVLVEISQEDVTTLAGARTVIQESTRLGPVAAVFNSAMILQDGLIENQTLDKFKAVCEPKVQATVYLDEVTRELCQDSLDWFVVFSSVVCGMGNLGQCNYGFANSVMERICEKRKIDGLHGLAIQWGVIGDVGYIAEQKGDFSSLVMPQKISSCLIILDQVLNQDYTIVTSLVLAPRQRKENETSNKSKFMESLARVLGIKSLDDLDPNKTLLDLGLDSLMGVEIKQLLERDFDISLNIKEVRTLSIHYLQKVCESEECHLNGDEPHPKAIQSTDQQDPMKSDSFDNTELSTVFNFHEMMPKKTLVRLNTVQNDLRPIFIIHAIEGCVKVLQDLGSLLPCPVYGVQLTAETPLESVESMAEFYLKQLASVLPEGPYRLAAYSYGSGVALEMALQLQRRYPDRPDIVEYLLFLDGTHLMAKVLIDTSRVTLISIGSEDEIGMLHTYYLSWFITQFTPVNQQELIKKMQPLKTIKDKTRFIARELMKTGLFNSEDDLDALAFARISLIHNITTYEPSQMYQGDLTLIRSKHNTYFPPVDEDHGLSQVCAGKTTFHVVEGNHTSFLLGDGAKRVANLIMPMCL